MRQTRAAGGGCVAHVRKLCFPFDFSYQAKDNHHLFTARRSQ